METHPDKDIYELINTDINNNFKKHTINLKKYNLKEIKRNFQKLKPILKQNTE
jgi:uncharacterized protein (UPF0254 family)